jgi:hypothetical protein
MFCGCLSTVSITRDTVEGDLENGFPVGWDQSGRSLFLRTNKVDDWCALWMRADSETHSGIAFDDMSNRRIEGTINWNSYDVVLDIPEDAKALVFGVVLYGIGQVWIDDCVLEVVGREVSTTGEFNPRMKVNRHPIPPDLKPEPMNMDFEGEVAGYLYDVNF